MKNYQNYVGIDVSKDTLDYQIIDPYAKLLAHGKISNDKVGVKQLFKLLKK